MTKTLTEQWKDGTLDQRYYYVKYFGNCQKPFVEIELKNFLLDLAKVKDNDRIEVLAPVPSYDEYKRLQERNEKLEKMAFHYTPEEWNTMLRTIERLQEQLKDAEYILDEMGWADRGLIDEYFEKWGVK